VYPFQALDNRVDFVESVTCKLFKDSVRDKKRMYNWL